jgi:geranylgeranyl diphosphate synthase type II
MSKSLQQFVLQHRPKIEEALFEFLPISHQRLTQRYNKALHYAIFPGGKRWRPLLTLLSGVIVGADVQNLLPAACAIEYLHSSSMIIDDLPAMDDADIRRGKPSLHSAFDESTAMLVSLGLMNHSYSLLALTCQKSGHREMAGALINRASVWIGADGMIGGQVVDLELRGGHWEGDILVSRNLKTTELMRLMMTAGAIAMNAYEEEIAALSRFGEALGMAYQICDDLLDELGDARVIGKPLKQDERHCSPSFVSQYGIVGAQRMATQLILDAKSCLHTQFGNSQEVKWLSEAAEMIVAPFNRYLANNKYDLVIMN